MFIKALKIFLFVCFAIPFSCFSQESSKLSDTGTVNKYNIFLKQVKLNRFLKAVDFKFEAQVMHKGTLGLVQRNNVNVLTLVPGPEFGSSSKFVEEWNRLVKSSAVNAYDLLFTRLTDYTGLAPETLVIRLKNGESDLYAYLIYFERLVRINKPVMGGRDLPVAADPGDLDDHAVGGIFTNEAAAPDINARIVKGLTAFFKTHKHDAPVVVESKGWASGNMHFKVTHLKGEVTRNLNEIVFLNVITQPAAAGRINLCYFFSVQYSGGIFTASDDMDDYKDALSSYKKEVGAYGLRLKQQLRSILKSR